MKSDYLWQIIFVLLGALASAYAGYWFGNQPDEVAVIEYREDINKNLKKLIGGTSEIEITYSGKKLNELSSVSYYIANTTNKNLDKFKLYFEIPNEKQQPIFHNINPPKDYPKEAITLISEKNGVYVFELEYLNKSDSIWSGLNFSFYFAGDEPPKISVKTGTKGLAIEEYSYKSPDVTEIILIVIQEAWLFTLIYVLGAYLFIRYGKTQRKIKRLEYKDKIEEILEDGTETTIEEKVNQILENSTKPPSTRKVLKNMFAKDNA